MTPESDLTLWLAIGTVLALSAFTVAFMAYALVLHLRNVAIGRRRSALERRWKPRLLDAATGDLSASHDGDGVMPDEARVDGEDRVLFLELVTGYARALDGPERRDVERLGRPYLDALEPLLDGSDAYRRAYALDILGELGSDAALQRLVRGLEDDSALVAMVAARALARRGDPDHVPLILARMDTFVSWSASYLASLLVSFGTEAAPPLRELATSPGGDPRFRSIALRALRELNDVGAVDAAVRRLPEERNEEIQSETIRLAGALGDPRHLDLIRPFASSATAHVRAASLRAVSSLSDRRTSDVEMVARGLDDPSPWVALQAAHGLLQLGRGDELADLARSGSPRAPLAAEVLEVAR